MVKISIIIPVYNVEKYLKQCLNSVLEQSFRDIEVICVDDESPDNCPKILDTFAENDRRVKVIHKKNEGQGVARNIGLEKAEGKYVMFVDSDDWLEPNALEKLFEKIEKDDTDIVCFNVYKFQENIKVKTKYHYILPYYSKFQESPFSPIDAGDVIFHPPSYPFKIYKKEMLKKYDIKYSKHKFWEDHTFNFTVLAQAEKISVLKDYLYNYRVHETSSTANAHKFAHTLFENFSICEKALKHTKHGEELFPYFLERKISGMFNYYHTIPRCHKKNWYINMKTVFKYINANYNKEILLKNNEFVKFKKVLYLPYGIFSFLNKLNKTIFITKYFSQI